MSEYIYSTHEHEVTSDSGSAHDTLYVRVDPEDVYIHNEDTPLLRLSWSAWLELVAVVADSHKELARK